MKPSAFYIEDEDGDREYNTIDEFSSASSGGVPLFELPHGERYDWKPPVLIVGERTAFQDNHGRKYVGECLFIETHYNHTGAAYHCYTMKPDGCKRCRIIGEDLLIGRPS